MIAFTIMAGLIMRLKVFWTPHLCVFASFICATNSSYCVIDYLFACINYFRQKRNSPHASLSKKAKFAIFVLIIGSMSYQGVINLKEQYSIHGEYKEYTLEMMMNWINENTRIDDSFAGSMSTMANVKLSTNRPIVNHPHYENTALRLKTKEIYSLLFGFRPVSELHSLLKGNFSTRYLIVEKHFCYSHPPGKPECGMSEIAHLDSLAKTTNRKACDLILSQEDNAATYFAKKFNLNHVYIFEII